MTDALVYDGADIEARLALAARGGRVNVVSRFPDRLEREGVTPYMRIDGESAPRDYLYPRLYLASVEEENAIIDRVAERVYEGAALCVRVSATLEEVGRLDGKYGLSPVMLLHKLGILDGALVTGGIYLDNDDVDLLAQCGARLALLPSTDICGGLGIPNTVSYISRGLILGVGTGTGAYTADVRREAELLRLVTNAQMCSPLSITDAQLENILEFR